MKGRAFIVTGAIVGVLVVAAWFVFLYSPANSELAKIRSDVEAAQAKQVQLVGQLKTLEKLKATEPVIDAGIARMQQATPDKPEISDFIRIANEAATRSGVDFLSVTPSDPAASKDGGPLSTVSVTIVVQGKYAQMEPYLEALVNLPRTFTVDNVALTADSPTVGQSPVLKGSITGRIFSSEPVAGAPGGAATAPPTTAPPASK